MASEPLNWDAYLERGRKEIRGVMENRAERNWTAHVVISSDHAGLRPYFKLLEAEVLRVLARIDDPQDVKRFLVDLVQHSKRYADGSDRPRYRK